MEGLELDVPAVVPQQVHHQLQILWFTDVFCHDSEVVSVQKKFPEELKTDRRTDGRRRHVICVSGVDSLNSDRSLHVTLSGVLPLKTAVW